MEKNNDGYKKSIISKIKDRCINLLMAIPLGIMAYMGFNPSFVGQKKLMGTLSKYIRHYGMEIILKPSGIYLNDMLLEKSDTHIMKFIPSEGIRFSSAQEKEIRQILLNAVTRKNPKVTRDYYRLYGLGLFVILTYFSILIFLGLMLEREYRFPTFQEKTLDILWFLPNVFFFTQAIIFYITRLNHFSLKHSFSEAGDEEEKELYVSQNQPYVISVVPAYMEEPELLKRTLYSICLQKYNNMRVVLLLGNDVLSTDPKVKENTREVKSLVLKMRREFKSQREIINHFIKNTEALDTENKAGACSELFEQISQWYLHKSQEFENCALKYPVDSFLIENTFNFEYLKIVENKEKCLYILKELKDQKLSLDNKEKYEGELKGIYNELKSMFRINPYVFMRTKYENLEQEKTKAGNLTAFSSIIGKTLKLEKRESGRYALISSFEGFKVEEPKYFASFDSDTILKPHYIIRKVAFLEKKENIKTGLIQSPYIVPDPEDTNVATASGIHTVWFLPMSVGFSPIKSAYWLGFNGVLRFDAVKKIKSFITDTIIEDTQNSIKMKSEGYEIVTSPEENCITFSPKDINALKVQRIRWASGGFKIAKNLLVSFKNGTSGMKGFLEKILSLNYVLGLNFLPIAIFIFTFLKSPFNYKYFVVEMIPFFLYLLSYTVLLKTNTRYSFLNMLDGLSISIFLMMYYIVGTFKSLGDLIVIKGHRFFSSTPKMNVSTIKWVGNIEFVGIIIVLVWSWLRLLEQFSHNVYYDFYPVLQIILILYGVDRFFGWDRIWKYIKKANKFSVIKNQILNIISGIKNLGKLKYTKESRTAGIGVIVVIISGISIWGIMDFNYRKNLHEEVISYLYVENNVKIPLDPYEQNKKLGRGLNVAGALEAPNEGDWLMELDEKHFKIIRDAGFDTIRVPIRWSAHASKKSPYKIESRFFERIDWLLIQGKKNNLNVVLDLHNYYEIYEKNPQKHFDRFVEIWKQIAQRYKNCDESVYYELINEPRERLTTGAWNELLDKTITQIRKIDNYHTIIIDAAQWGSAYGLMGLKIPENEKNVICSFHTYTPQMFTHQGAEYAPDEYRYSANVQWPGPPEKPVSIPEKLKTHAKSVAWLNDYNTMPYEENPGGPKPIVEEMDFAYKWGIDNKRPIWLGEFGAINNTDDESQIRWSAFVAREAEKRGMTWAYWDFADTCRIYDLKRGKWKEGLLNALMKP